ncbi:hypothetical protein TNIN_84591, partial [Trichonephila inaurata madagascariensis]
LVIKNSKKQIISSPISQLPNKTNKFKSCLVKRPILVQIIRSPTLSSIHSPSSSGEDLFQPTVLVNVTPSCLNTPKNPLNAHREHIDREKSRPSHLRSVEGEGKKEDL